MMPWFALYNHTTYTCWGTVYLADFKQLEATHPDVYKEFLEGNLVVKSPYNKFNQLSTYQAWFESASNCHEFRCMVFHCWNIIAG